MSDKQPKDLSNEQMGSLVAKLKAEGRFPSPEKLVKVVGKIRQEYQPKILEARKEGPPRRRRKRIAAAE
jgi:hypothetical protein